MLGKCHACDRVCTSKDWYYVGPAWDVLTSFLDFVKDEKNEIELAKAISFSEFVKGEFGLLHSQLKFLKELQPELAKSLDLSMTKTHSALEQFEAEAKSFGARSRAVFTQLKVDADMWRHLQDLEPALKFRSDDNLLIHLRKTLTAWAGCCKRYEDVTKAVKEAFEGFQLELQKCQDWYSSRIETDEIMVKLGVRRPRPTRPVRPPPATKWWKRFFTRAISISAIVVGGIITGLGMGAIASGTGCGLGIPLVGCGASMVMVGTASLVRVATVQRTERQVANDYRLLCLAYPGILARYEEEVETLTTLTVRKAPLEDEKNTVDQFQTENMIPILFSLQELLGRLQGKRAFTEFSLIEVPTTPLELEILLEGMHKHTSLALHSSAAKADQLPEKGFVSPILKRFYSMVDFKTPIIPKDTFEIENDHDNDPEILIASLPVTKLSVRDENESSSQIVYSI